MPLRLASAPPSSAATSSSRANSALPRVRLHNRWRNWPSTGPPSTSPTSRSSAGRLSGSRSSRPHSPSFHSPTTASGASSPRRTVASTRRPSWLTSWWASAAEASSRAWASSIASTAGVRARIASRARVRDAASSNGRSGRERTERHDAGRTGGAHLQDAHAREVAPLDRLREQARLADARVARQHQALAGGQSDRDLFELGLAPDQWPRQVHTRPPPRSWTWGHAT